MALPNGTYVASVSITLGVWVRRSGAWQRLTQVYAQFDGEKSNGGSAAYSAYYDGSLALGGGIEAFGVTVDGVSGGSNTVAHLTRVAWTSQGSAGGTRSALPNGTTTTITVRPRG